jgi:hypothetical protein
MKSIRDYINLIESAQVPVAEGYTPTAGELAQDHIKMADSDFNKKYGMSKQQAKQHYSSNKLKDQDVAEAEGEYKVYYMTAEDHKLMGRYPSRKEAEQRLNQLQSKYPDNKFIIQTSNKQGVAEGTDTMKYVVYRQETTLYQSGERDHNTQAVKSFPTEDEAEHYAEKANDTNPDVDVYYFVRAKKQDIAEGQTTRTCPQCDGSGEDTLDPTKSCRRCSGKGHIPMSPREQEAAKWGRKSSVYPFSR